MATANTDSTQEATTQETDYSQFQGVNFELRKLLEDRQNKSFKINPLIVSIQRRTQRVIKDKVTEAYQFMYENGKVVKEGVTYHIHYTRDLSEFFMIGTEHDAFSKLIFPVRSITQFGYYNRLNKRKPMTIIDKITYPSENDYKNGSYTRYFARKANEERLPAFEVSNADFERSPLYIYVSVKWHLTGTEAQVYFRNGRQISLAMKTIPNIYKLLNQYQFFRLEENLTSVELVKKRLGIITTNINTTTQIDNTELTGPPAGVLTGGAGGATY